MLRIVLSIAAAASLAACATTPETRAKEMAYCERMEREMGVEHMHDHGEARGMGVDPMNVSHARCRQMLGMQGSE